MWVAMLKSGVHATLAGIILALFIPLKRDATGYSMLKSMEHDLHGTVAYFVLPVFAFANAETKPGECGGPKKFSTRCP